MEAFRFANKSAPLHIGDNMPDPNTCGNEYAALTGSPYAPRFKEQAYVAEINQLLVRVAELEIQNLGLSEQAIKDRREAGELRARVAELEAILRRVDAYFQRTGKVGDLPVSVHALLPKLIHRHEDGTETTVTPLPMWQP